MPKKSIVQAAPENTSAEVFARRLRYLLSRPPETSQAKLSEVLGITRQAVGQYLSGRNIPGPKILAALASYFGTTADFLLGLAGEVPEDAAAPRICSVLGVNVDEPFQITGKGTVIWRVNKEGNVVHEGLWSITEPPVPPNKVEDKPCKQQLLTAIINNPSMITVRGDLELDPSAFSDIAELNYLLDTIRNTNCTWITREKDKISFWESLPQKVGETFQDGFWKATISANDSQFTGIPIGSCWNVRRFAAKAAVQRGNTSCIGGR